MSWGTYFIVHLAIVPKLGHYTVASGFISNIRTAENLPWKELESIEGQEHYLVNHAQFAPLGFLNPPSTSSHDALCAFATKLMLPLASPLFKSAATSSSPLNTPSSSPPSSPNQGTTDLHIETFSENTELEGTLNYEPATPPFPQPTPAQTNPLFAPSRPSFKSAPPPRNTSDTVPTPTPPFLVAPQLNAPAAAATAATTVETSGDTTPDIRNTTEEGTTPPAIAGVPESPTQEQGTTNGAIGGDNGTTPAQEQGTTDSAVGEDNGNGKGIKKRKRGLAARPPVSTRSLRSSTSQQPSTTYVTPACVIFLLHLTINSARGVLVPR